MHFSFQGWYAESSEELSCCNPKRWRRRHKGGHLKFILLTLKSLKNFKEIVYWLLSFLFCVPSAFPSNLLLVITLIWSNCMNIKTFGCFPSPKELVELTLRTMDQDKDGKISKADFQTTVKNFPHHCAQHLKEPIYAGDQVSPYAGSLWHLPSIEVNLWVIFYAFYSTLMYQSVTILSD